MGKAVDVNGLFSVRMDVREKGGTSVSTLTSSTQEPFHVIFVKNISGVTRSVKFENELPNGTSLMEFTGPRVTADKWDDSIDKIPDGATRERKRSLLHKTGSASKQPLQCSTFQQVLGDPSPPPNSARKWRKETNNVPFDHKIDIGN
jgi:hypothetical protein